MIIIGLITITGAVFSGLLAPTNRENISGFREIFQNILVIHAILILLGAPVFYFILNAFTPSKYYYFAVGIILLLFGSYLIGLIGPLQKTITETNERLLYFYSTLGNVFLIVIFLVFYNISLVNILFIFSIFYVLAIISAIIIKKYRSNQKVYKNLREILELTEMFNGIYLVSTGLIVVSDQIIKFEQIIDNMIK